MTTLRLSFIALCLILVPACNSNKPADNSSTSSATVPVTAKTDSGSVAPGSASKGIGRFNNVVLATPLDAEMIAKGKTIYDTKCNACHKLTSEKLVGPGWKGVTSRHSPEWIMNFITNTEVMLDKDLTAQAEVVSCLVRMPNQDLTDDQARQILEFQRDNDLAK